MGRVARYKKVKSVDPFAKGRTWTDDVGNTSNIQRVKRRSKTAQKLKDQKNKNRRSKSTDKKKRDDDGFNLPPDGEDEFDMSDLMGSVKKQKVKADDLLKGNNSILDNVLTQKNGGDKVLSSKVEKADARGVKSSASTSKEQSQSSSNQSKTNATSKTSSSKGLEITAHTPTREIIAACTNPKTQKQQGADGTNSKQAKRKAFFEQKKLKKRKHARNDSFDEDYDNYNNDMTSAVTKQRLIDDQVERPPIFSALPRGATKKKKSTPREKKEDQDENADRILKEQRALEAMRERVMAQYAILRESRRK